MSDTSGTALAPIEVHAALHPLKTERADLIVPPGATLDEIFALVQPDAALRQFAHIYIGPDYIEPEYWNVVRPKAGTMVCIRPFAAPRGGQNGKDIMRSVLLIAVSAAALAFGGPLAGMIGLTGAFGAAVGQAVIGIGGMLLINALIPPRSAVTQRGGDGTEDSPLRFIENARNSADPFGVVPDLFGKMRIVPKLAAQPYTEIVGDDQYLNMLFHWGVGPIDFDMNEFKIGENLLSQFDEVRVQHREGYASDTTINLFPSVVTQDSFNIILSEPDGYTIRTTAADADRVGIDIIFADGLLKVDDKGTRTNRSVTIKVQYSVAGAGSWQDIPVANLSRTFPLEWTNSNGTTFDQITFTSRKTTAIREGFTFDPPTRDQFDIRIKRVTANSSSDQIRDIVSWAALRTYTNEHPVQSPVPVALTALRIKATDQLNGVIDEFNGLATRVCLDWNGASWVTRATQNPASLYRYALQSKSLQEPIPDAMIDLVQLQHWHEFCDDNDFTFNQWRDFSAPHADVLADIAAAGRASPQMIDGKYSVVIDEPKTPVQMVTSRNAWGFEANKGFVDKPHAIRIQFQNEEKDYRTDEIRVYLDGYTAATATKFESASYPGVTNPDQIAKMARFDAAVAIHRPEQFTFNQDMERLVYRRGDVIVLNYDVILIGNGSGRIKTLITDGGGNVTAVVVDTPLVFDTSITYGLAMRTVEDAALVREVVDPGVDGEQTTVTFTNSIPASAGLVEGALFAFGPLGLETDEALIIDVDPSGDLYDARVTAVPYREIVYEIDSGPIPPFDSRITPITAVPDVQVIGVRSDESVLTVGAGSALIVHIGVKVEPIEDDGTVDVQIRPSTTNAPFKNAQVDQFVANELFIADVRTGEYFDIRVRWNLPGRVPGDWTYIYNHRVVGKANPPAPLVGMTVSAFGGQAFIRWDKPVALDVVFGGTVSFRHTEELPAEWGNSLSIGNVAQADAGIATLPLKAGTYLAQVTDSSGLKSTISSVETKQASILEFILEFSLDEAPSFAGTKTNVIADTITGTTMLFIEGVGDWDDVPDVDAIIRVDALGGVDTVGGTYDFANKFDFGAVRRMRLTTQLTTFNAAVFDLIDEWTGDIDDRANFDGTETADCDCIIYVSLTDDDPNGVSPTWGEYERLDSAEVETRGCRFRAVLSSVNADYNIYVSQLGIVAEAVA